MYTHTASKTYSLCFLSMASCNGVFPSPFFTVRISILLEISSGRSAFKGTKTPWIENCNYNYAISTYLKCLLPPIHAGKVCDSIAFHVQRKVQNLDLFLTALQCLSKIAYFFHTQNRSCVNVGNTPTQNFLLGFQIFTTTHTHTIPQNRYDLSQKLQNGYFF